LRDLPRQFLPRYDPPTEPGRPAGEADRGTVLERLWTELQERRIRDYWNQEAQGRLPSLILSPMMVEDGRLLLISNLDLQSNVAPCPLPPRQGRGAGPEPPRWPVKDRTRTGMVFAQGSKVTEVDEGTEVGIFSLYGLEFF